MQIYNYDSAGVFTASGTADDNPLEPGQYLIPANATDIAPPAVTAGNQAVFSAGAWSVQAIPTPAQAAAATLTQAEINAQDRANIQATLDTLDGQRIRALSDIAIAQAAGQTLPAYSVTKLQSIEAQAVTLRQQLAAIPA